MPLAAVMLNTASETYVEMIQKTYYTAFVEQLNVTVSVFFTAIAFFIFVQTVLNLVVVLYRSFMRTRKASFLMILFTFVAVFIPMKTGERLANFVMPLFGSGFMPDILLLSFTGWFLVFSVLYFFITILLFEHRVEI